MSHHIPRYSVHAPHRLPQPRHVGMGHFLDWLKFGWQMFSKNPGVWVVQAILMIVVLFALGIVPVINFAIVPIAFPILAAGMLAGCRALERNEPLEVGHLFTGLREHLGNLTMVGMFYFLGGVCAGLVALAIGGSAVLTGSLLGSGMGMGVGLVSGVVIGSILFMLLWILLITALWFAPSLVFLDGIAPLDAMRLSVQACFKNIGTFAFLGVFLYVATWVAMLPAGLGVLVLIPVIAGVSYASWRDVFLPAVYPATGDATAPDAEPVTLEAPTE